MSHTPVGGHPQGWEHKLGDRASLPPASGEDKTKSQPKHVFTQPYMPKAGAAYREETEGSSGSSRRSPAPASSPPYMRWARSLHSLLEDAEGVRLFRKFVSGAGGLHVDRLNFYFAVQGLRQESEANKIRQVVSAIYKFLRKSQLSMPEQLKASVKSALKEGGVLDPTVFDHMEQEVTLAITETTYQAFLRSDAYVAYVAAATQPLSPDQSPPNRDRDLSSSSVSTALATLHEGEELSCGMSSAGGSAARLTHTALLATQTRRLHSAPAAHHKRSVYSAHVSYAGYCPASRQDSERASLSSGRTDRTDSDAVSLSGSSLDGMSVRGVRDRERPRLPGQDRHAVINREHHSSMVIPRSQRMQSAQLRVLPPAEFAPLLIERLERLRRDQDNKDRLDRRLAESEGEEATLALPPQLVAAAIREKLQLDDDNDQDILDQHVSRVWSERTPRASPPPRAPPPPRRALSQLSSDSGHYDQPPQDQGRTRDLPRRSYAKKAPTELTDSGVSVVSEGASSGGGTAVMLWVAEAERRRQHAERGGSADRDRERREREREKARRTTPKAVPGAVSSGAGDHTVVVVSFLDESVPYRFKVPGAPLTLKVFKDYLPRKGNYRYFFKTECADLDNTVIQEEVSNDTDTLPMFEGKVMARVKSIE